MKKEPQIPVVSKDILDIIKATKSLNSLQKQELIATILRLRTKKGD